MLLCTCTSQTEYALIWASHKAVLLRHKAVLLRDRKRCRQLGFVLSPKCSQYSTKFVALQCIFDQRYSNAFFNQDALWRCGDGTASDRPGLFVRNIQIYLMKTTKAILFVGLSPRKLVNTDTIRPGGGEKTLRSPRLPPPNRLSNTLSENAQL